MRLNLIKTRVLLYLFLALVMLLQAQLIITLSPTKVVFLMFAVFGSVVILGNPSFGIYLLVFDFLLVQRSYTTIGDIPVLRLVGFLIILSCALHRKKIVGLTNPITVLLTILTLYQFFSYYSYFRTFDFTILNNMVFYFMILWVLDFKDQKEIKYISLMMLIGGVILCTQGFLTMIVTRTLTASTFLGWRHWIAFYVILIIPFSMILINQIDSTSKKLLIRIAIVTFISYVLLTLGRITIAILMINLIFFMIFNFSQPLMSRRKIIAFMCAGFLLLIFSGGFGRYFLKLPDTSMRLSLEDTALNAFSSGRGRIYKEGIDMFLDYPIFGGGYKRFSHISNKYNTWVTPDGTRKISMHSIHLQYLAEMGVVGLLLYWGTMSLIAYKALKARKYFISNDDSLLECISVIVFLGILSFFLGGIIGNYGLLLRQFYLLAGLAAGYLDIQDRIVINKPRLSHRDYHLTDTDNR